MSAHFQLELNTLGVFSDPTDKNKGYLLSNVFIQFSSKTTNLQAYVYLNVAACFGVENSLLKYVQAYILYTQDRSTSTQSLQITPNSDNQIEYLVIESYWTEDCVS